MSFSLRIQDPASQDSTFLELLLECAGEFNHGGGAFAFASVHGVQLLVGDPVFSDFLNRGSFELIIGVDAVTVPATLDLLREFGEQFPNFQARVFFHERAGTLFHPKFSWFAAEKTGRTLVGSGNLTRGGLLKNWETFADARLCTQEIQSLAHTWNVWRTLNAPCLRDVTDLDVITRASLNIADHSRRHQEDTVEQADSNLNSVPGEAPVLIAEIPKASNRWNQANFDLKTFTDYFELTPGRTQRIALFPVAPDGSLGEPEIRPSVSVKSRNFRIELGQASGLSYPSQDRPIGVFLRLGTRRFRYRLLLPTDPDYPGIAAVLTTHWHSRPDRMRRILLPLQTLRAALPSFLI